MSNEKIWKAAISLYKSNKTNTKKYEEIAEMLSRSTSELNRTINQIINAQ